MGSINGQTFNDRILAARHSLAGQGLAKSVCKATTEELIGPKKKHLDYLLHCTEEPNVSIPTLANLLIERTQSTNWIVVFKGLVTIHHLMCYGNERFVQYLASSNTNFQLSGFLDKSGVQGGGTVRGYDMSPFIRRYAKYLNEKAVSYRTVAFDFCKVKRGKDGGTLRTMSTEKLFKTIYPLQNQIDALADFDVTTNDLNNGVINSAFMLLFRDLIRLFACYNDGIINLLKKYFDMNKKNAREALEIYKKFLIRMDRVANFLKVAEKFGVDKNDIPDLTRIVGIDGDIPDFTKAPSSLLEGLESHLASLEGRKPGSTVTTPTGSSAVTTQVDEKLQQQFLAEEEQAMAKYKEQHRATNPFATTSDDSSSVTASSTTESNGTPNILDLFGCAAPATTNGNTTKTSDDLLQLSGGNPFASVLSAAQPAALNPPATAQPVFNNSPFAAASPFGNDLSNANGHSHHSFFSNTTTTTTTGPQIVTNSFTSDNALQNAFGSKASTLFNPDNAFQNAFGSKASTFFNDQRPASDVGASFFGDILQPQGTGGVSTNNKVGTPTNSNAKVITGDLDASLANLTSNLNLGAGPSKKMTSIRN